MHIALKKTFKWVLLLLLILLSFLGAKGYWITVRPLWLNSMATSLPTNLCKDVDDKAMRCAFNDRTDCGKLLRGFVDECLISNSSQIPFIIIQPTRGELLGREIGKCVDTQIASLAPGRSRGSRECTEHLHKSSFASDQDSINWRFLKQVEGSASLQALEEASTGTIENVYTRGLAQQTFNLEISLARIRARKDAILSAGNKEILDFARAHFAKMKAFCKHGELAASAQKLAKGDQAEATREIANMRAEDLKDGGKWHDLGQFIAAIPEDIREKYERDEDMSLAVLIRSARMRERKERSLEELNLASRKLEGLLTKDEITLLESQPTSCRAFEIYFTNSLKLDEDSAVVILQQIFK